MTTLFDVVTVTCFAALVLAFFWFTDRSPGVMTRMMASAVAFAVANQAGNAGWTVVALGLVVAGCAFAVYTVRTSSE